MRNLLKSGIDGIFFLPFFASAGDVFLSLFGFAVAFSLSIESIDSGFFGSPPCADPSMISSSSSTFSAGTSAISGRLWRFFATGICAAPASAVSAALFEIITTCLSARSAARCTNFKLTALWIAPIRFGGTSATISCSASLILPIIAVISSSTSI